MSFTGTYDLGRIDGGAVPQRLYPQCPGVPFAAITGGVLVAMPNDSARIVIVTQLFDDAWHPTSAPDTMTVDAPVTLRSDSVYFDAPLNWAGELGNGGGPGAGSVTVASHFPEAPSCGYAEATHILQFVRAGVFGSVRGQIPQPATFD